MQMLFVLLASSASMSKDPAIFITVNNELTVIFPILLVKFQSLRQ